MAAVSWPPVGLKAFERKLENMVEGAFSRVFKSGLRPIEIGRRLTREMDDNRSVDVRGRTVAPNAFVVHIDPTDRERFVEIEDHLCRELADAAREHARDEGYSFLGPVEVELETDERLHTGSFRIDARLREGPSGTGAGSLLLPNNDRYVLAAEPITIGRSPDCDITIVDSNVSRRHAEIQPRGDGFVVIDLESTNGTRVNGVRVTERELQDGDELAFGNTRMIFQAS
jgi:hypothetical protein